MKKNEFNTKLRDYARTLSPRVYERTLISSIYKSFQDLLSANNCVQIGSYPRFTSITPVHDLDILYILGEWNENAHDPSTALEQLYSKVNQDYENPTNYQIKVSLQTHSVTVLLTEGDEEILSIDIVPAYILSKNEFTEDTYKVPEIIKKKHGKSRTEYYQKLASERRDMEWIKSDPRGYIKVASDVDSNSNGDFRKSAKIIKHWKNKLKEIDETLKLKSFHLEQVVTEYFLNDNSIQIYDAVYRFFVELPQIINTPNQIQDRANSDKYIDDYLSEFNEVQKKAIINSRDAFLIKLESLSDSAPISTLFEIELFERSSLTEKYLFDNEFRIPVLIEDQSFKIDGFIQKKPGFRDGWLSEVSQQIAKGRHVKFQIRSYIDKDYSLWKVQNDKDSEEVLADKCTRGELTKDRTHKDPESTAYTGRHYVECFAIRNDVCIARSKIDVVIS